MKTIFACTLIMCLCSCSSSRVEIPDGAQKQEVSWESGSLKQRYYIAATDETLRVGPYIEWYESGSLKVRGQYQSGKKDGYWHYYNEKGYKDKKVLFNLGEPKRTIIPSPTHHYDHYWHRHCLPHHPYRLRHPHHFH